MFAQGRALHFRIRHAGTEPDRARFIVDVPTLQLVYLSQGDDIVDRRTVEVHLDHQVGATLHEARTWMVAKRLQHLLQ